MEITIFIFGTNFASVKSINILFTLQEKGAQFIKIPLF